MRFHHSVSVIALAVMAQIAGQARAEDDASRSSIETPFGGFYVGADIAHNLANNQLKLGDSSDFITLDGWGASGPSGGVFVGYDRVLGNGFLIGGQIGGSISDLSSRVSYSESGSGSVSGKLKTDWYATASARAGYLTNPETLLFGSLGVMVAHGVGSYFYTDGIDSDSGSDSQFFYGLAIGSVGVETVLSGKLRGRFEYVASYLNTQTFDFDGVTLDVQPIIGSAKVSLVYGFGEPTPVMHDFASAPETWTGFFGGLRGGHEMGSTKLEINDGPTDFAFDGFGSNGLMVGGFVGYNQQLGERFVVGVEGGVSATTINNEIIVDVTSYGTGSIKTGTEWAANARLRAGVLVNPATLIYGFGGYSRNHMYVELTESGSSDRGEFSVDAVEFGGGVETFVSPKVSVRGEYGLVLTDNLLDEMPYPGSLKKLGATGSLAAVLHF